MGSLVSSQLDFLDKNPAQQISFAQMEHELKHLSKREQFSTAVAFASAILGILSLGAVILGGPFIMGALFAIAAVAAAYAYCCRLAEVALRNKVGAQKTQIELPSVPAAVSQVLTHVAS